MKNAGVLPTSREKMTVVMEKGNVGHMAAMPTIDMAGSLWMKRKKSFIKYDLTEWSILKIKCKKNLTLGWEQGLENKCTLPKSSAEARRLLSCDLHTALMSVPSAPSGQIP